MTDDPRSLPYEMSDYPETSDAIGEYRKAVMEKCDKRMWLSALDMA